MLAPSELLLDMHPADARSLGIADGQQVTVSSRRGALITRVRISLCVQAGQVFLPMHDPRVNQLTHASFDPHSRQPSYKHSAVKVSKAQV
jgi:assimilatory nitrate reductase catalytic subunit